jgi:hypothetical protein
MVMNFQDITAQNLCNKSVINQRPCTRHSVTVKGTIVCQVFKKPCFFLCPISRVNLNNKPGLYSFKMSSVQRNIINFLELSCYQFYMKSTTSSGLFPLLYVKGKK